MFKVTGARESFSSSPWPAELADVLGGKLTKQSGNSMWGLAGLCRERRMELIRNSE